MTRLMIRSPQNREIERLQRLLLIMLKYRGKILTIFWKERGHSRMPCLKRYLSTTSLMRIALTPVSFFSRLIPLSQVNQDLGLAGQIRNGAGFEFVGRS